MHLIDTGPEPFFEDVVNHMASICGTPLALVAIQDSGRAWVSRVEMERGIETRGMGADLIARFGTLTTEASGVPCSEGDWPFLVLPHSFISVPFSLRGGFVGILVIADSSPRQWTAFDRNYMARAARLVASHFEARAALAERDIAQQQLKAAMSALEDERNRLEARVFERTRELANATREAQSASAAKSMFLASVSHELRTPLHQIIGYAEMLQEEMGQPPADLGQVCKDLGSIVTASHHLLSLIGGVLDITKIESGQLSVRVERFDPAPLLEECMEGVRHACEKAGNALSMNLAPGLDDVTSDRQRLKQCLLNLLSNAAKFTRDGAIALNVDRLERADGAWLRLQVADTGAGMSAEEQQRLFEPFYQTRSGYARPAEGAGLGLALTRGIVDCLNGTIEVDSAPNIGSTFTIYLPLETALAAAG